MNATAPTSVDEVRQFVRDHSRVIACGAGTKSPPPQKSNAAVLDMTALAGLVEYQPEEFTFTALAGTPVRVIEAALAQHGQYLPFDPMLSAAGATLGGTVAAGVSGPGRLRYGGLRDFLIGVAFIDGNGALIHGGGKVVKNAAGFDFPKLMIGSAGTLGVLTELTFKVFPRPRGSATLRLDGASLNDALAALTRLTAAPLDLDALELEPPGSLIVRLAGEPAAMAARAHRVADTAALACRIMEDPESQTYWNKINAMTWTEAGTMMVKIPVTPARIIALDQRLSEFGVARRYSVAGNVAWIACPDEATVDALHKALTDWKMSGVVVRGNARILGVNPGRPLAACVKQALDPDGRFPELL